MEAMTDSNRDLAGLLAERHGLARVRLFDADVEPGGLHDVLLDGPFGSFAISEAGADVSPIDAASWAWSANVPHHVTIAGDRIESRRWDVPFEVRSYSFADAMRSPGSFYEHMRNERADESRSIVAQNLTFFRTVRVLVRQRGGSDEDAVAAYLQALDLLALEDRLYARPASLAPQIDALGTKRLVDVGDLHAAMSGFASAEMNGHRLRAWASLSLRHASGIIFQEAHHLLASVPEPNLFGFVDPIRAKAQRGGVHFTPPTLARSLAEQALGALGDLAGRKTITVADYTCGSGAFLVECVRALDRLGYGGQLRVVGRDISARAVTMATFVLGRLGDGLRNTRSVRLDIKTGDALVDDMPSADVVVLNPPFMAWNDMSKEDRSLARQVVSQASRPDLSMAFVTTALKRLKVGGALAAIVPARVLEAPTNRSWRENLTDGHGVPFVATFDDLSLFRGAVVRVGALVCTSGLKEGGTLVLRAGRGAGATSDALRALRKGDLIGITDFSSTGWGIDVVKADVARALNDFPTTTRRTVHAVPRMGGAGQTIVEDLFDVYMGVRSGGNPAFVLSENDFLSLPLAERRWFKRTITSEGISAGRIVNYVYLFYPYEGSKVALRTEDELKAAVPEYFTTRLTALKPKLVKRQRPGPARWWLLGERRPRFDAGVPAIVSKYFGGAQCFALNADRVDMLLQGFAWFPKSPLISAFRQEGTNDLPHLAKAYLTLLNSEVFANIVAAAYPPTLGGQRNMSKQFMNPLPLPNLLEKRFTEQALLLASYTEFNYLGRDGVKHPSKEVSESLAADLLLQPSENGAVKPLLPNILTMPDWAQALANAGMSEDTHDISTSALGAMYKLAMDGNVQQIDEVFDHIDISALAGASLMTLLRGSAPFEHLLADWAGFRDRVRAEFEKRGRPVERVMRGLL